MGALTFSIVSDLSFLPVFLSIHSITSKSDSLYFIFSFQSSSLITSYCLLYLSKKGTPDSKLKNPVNY